MKPKELSIIVALSDHRAIGRGNKMPWHIAEDMKFFKKTTMGGTVIMGRKTWESLGCKALPHRQNLVVSRSLQLEPVSADLQVTVARTLEEAVEAATADRIFVIGGGEIYRQAISLATRIYMTKVHTYISDADTFFPELDSDLWMEVLWSEIQRDA